MRRLVLSFLIVAALCISHGPSLMAAEPPESSVVFIEVGYMDNTTFVKVEEGTGFLIHPAGWVLTAKHVSEAALPEGKIRYFRGAVRSRTASFNQLFEVPVPVVSADVSLLRFSPNLRSDWSFLKIKANHPFKKLDNVTAYGFPNGNDIEVRPGVVSNLLGPKGSLGVNVGLAPGMSGGPVLLSGGRCVVGVVAGGSGYPSFDYFTPTQYAKTLLEIPPATFVTEIAAAADANDNSKPPLFDTAHRVDMTLADHEMGKTSRNYSFDFKADRGAKIVSARLVEESAAAAFDKNLDIQGDRRQATFRFRLESGPLFDQWRGWWHGQVVLTQQRDQPDPQISSSCD